MFSCILYVRAPPCTRAHGDMHGLGGLGKYCPFFCLIADKYKLGETLRQIRCISLVVRVLLSHMAVFLR